MDINDLRGLSTLFLMVSFIGMCIWVYSRKRKKSYDAAANLPFADEELNRRSLEEQKEETKNA